MGQELGRVAEGRGQDAEFFCGIDFSKRSSTSSYSKV